MIKNIILLMSSFIFAFSCFNNKSQDGKYFIEGKNEIGNYFVYHARLNSDESKIILMSIKKKNCETKEEIKVGQSYTFELVKMTYIITEEGVSISLVRGQSINGIKLSDGKNFPYLIRESCNGFYNKK